MNWQNEFPSTDDAIGHLFGKTSALGQCLINLERKVNITIDEQHILRSQLTTEGKRSAILQEALEEIAEGSGTDPQRVAKETLEAVAELR